MKHIPEYGDEMDELDRQLGDGAPEPMEIAAAAENDEMALLLDDQGDTRPALAVADEPPEGRPYVLQVHPLRPAPPARGMRHLMDVAKEGIPFVFQSAREKGAWCALDYGWGTPAFCQLSRYLLSRDAEDDVEWMARFLAYIRIPERHQMPEVPDAIVLEQQCGSSIEERLELVKQTAEQYMRLVDGMVLAVQASCGAEWPGNAHILLWVHVHHPRPLWHTLKVLLTPPQWHSNTPPFWDAQRMENALADEPALLDFWKAVYARYQSRAAAPAGAGE